MSYTQPVPRLLLALLLLSACHRCSAPDTLVAVVEQDDAIHLKRQTRDGWTSVRTLPSEARSIQVSPDGRSVAWVQDVTLGAVTTMEAWTWPSSADAPTKLGEIGLRRVDAPGLAIDDDGHTLWVDRVGELQVWPTGESLEGGLAPRTAAGTWGWIESKTGCLRARGLTVESPLCDPVAILLDLRADRIVVATTTRIAVAGEIHGEWPIDEAQAAALSADGKIAVVHRARRGGAPVDALAVITPDGPQPVLQRALIVSLDWASEDSLLVVQKKSREDIYELMLAHTPAEFGGEAASGTAVRVTLDGREALIEGLPEHGVRLVHRVR